MTKATSIIEKKAFVSLVMTKLVSITSYNNGGDKLLNKLEGASDIHKQYTTAMRYARNHKWGYNASDQDHDKRMWVKELEHKKKQWKDKPDCYTGKPIKNIWSLPEEPVAITEAEAEAPVTVPVSETPIVPVNDTQPVTAFWAKPETRTYIELVEWLAAIDSGTINGTVKEAKEFISTIDGYTDKLQALIVDQSKKQLKDLLRQVKDCEAVLDRSEVENIWLEVGTETGGELMVTPYSRENNRETTQLVPLNSCGL